MEKEDIWGEETMKEYKTLEERDRYYRDKSIQMMIAHHCRYREVTIIKHLDDKDMALRPFKIFKQEHFNWLYQRLHLDKIKFDIYISNASVKLPPLPSRPEELKEARKMLNETWMERLTGYDYFVDIDANGIDDEPEMIEWAKKIRNKRQNLKIWKTGSGGIHLIQKGDFNPEYIKNDITNICCELSLPLRQPVKTINDTKYISVDGREWVKIEKEDIPLIEKPFIDNGIYDIRRIRRVPFSIHDKTGRPMIRVA